MKKTALITGASSGIGKEFAKIHAERGGDLVIVARSEDKLNALQKELHDTYNVSVLVIPKDLTEPNAPNDIYEVLNSANVHIDYLINNAGFGGVGKFHERDWEKDQAMIQLNVMALTALTRKFLPSFVARNSGRILNVSSTASLMPGPLQAVYFATKAYVTSFSNAIAEELHDTNVTVTALLPGATETNFGKTSGMDKTKLFDDTADPESVTKAGYEAMLEGELNVVAGVSFAQKMMMKTLPLMPKGAVLKQVRKMQEQK
ncbi:MAG: SDR family oxidoreductase [Leeuwenhoekiella sp.]